MSLANASLGSQLDMSRPASASDPYSMQLRQPVILPQRRGESAFSRLAPKLANQRSDSATELRPAPDTGNNQRVAEWQARNEVVKNADQVRRQFQSESDSGISVSEQRKSYYSSQPQSEVVDSGYVVSRSVKTASPLPQNSSLVPAITDYTPVSQTPVYSGDERYQPPKLQPDAQNQRFVTPVQPLSSNVRPPMSEIVRHPFSGMVPVQDVRHSSQAGHPNLPDFRQQAPGIQYQPSGSATSTDVAVSLEQKPSYYSTRPQSELIEPGYVMSMPAPAYTLSQGTSMPEISADDTVLNHFQTSAGAGQQSSATEIVTSIGTAVYPGDQKYQPQQLQQQVQRSTYGSRFPTTVQPQMANVRPLMSEVVRHPLLGMIARDVQHGDPNVHANLQPAAVTSAQYQPLVGHIQSSTSASVPAPGMRYGVPYVTGGITAVSGIDGRQIQAPSVRYGSPDIDDRRLAPAQRRQYEMPNVDNREVPVGIPYTAREGPYRPPQVARPTLPPDMRYGMPNVTSSVRPVGLNTNADRTVPQASIRYGTPNIGGEISTGVRYNQLSSQDRVVESMPGISREAQVDQVGRPQSQYSIPSQTVALTNVRYDASNAGDGWPSPPPVEYYRAPDHQVEFSVPTVRAPPPNSQFAGSTSRPFPSEIYPGLQHTGASLGLPASEVRPKKQPPPIAAKPKFPVSVMKTKETAKDEGKQLKPEKMQQKMLEIQRLESQPYLTANEQTRLQNLRVEVEFDKRLAEMTTEKHDYDTGFQQHKTAVTDPSQQETGAPTYRHAEFQIWAFLF